MFRKEYLQYWMPPTTKEIDLGVPVKHTPQNYRGKEVKLIVLNTVPHWLRPIANRHQFCSYSNCRISFDPRQSSCADAVLFHSVDLGQRPSERPLRQPWVLYGWESPVHTNKGTADPKWKGVFNYTMTYRTDSDLFSPVGMFVKASESPDFNRLKDLTVKKKRTAAWIVSNCHVQSKLEVFVKRMQKIIDVDIFGRCGNKRCGDNSQCLHMLSDEYKFYLSFENSLCTDYVTEKLYKTFTTTSVPVVRGGADYASLVPSGTYIDARDFSSPESLAKHLLYLSQNVTAYMEILVKTKSFRVWDSMSLKQMAFCKLCHLLNNPEYKVKTYSDIDAWFRQGMCQSPVDL